ncbi:MAG: UDP-N-acetylglucosamine 2-epimerase, partial [Candidatus Neomarinimicrobiota bacterium]
MFFLIYGISFFFINFGPNTTTFLIPSEIYPTTIRAKAHGISAAIGKVLSQNYYDGVAVLGDRFEMLAAASGVVPFCIPIIHFHGGSITEGAIDDSFRHAITKLSHYHMVETKEFKERVLQLGEPKKNII